MKTFKIRRLLFFAVVLLSISTMALAAPVPIEPFTGKTLGQLGVGTSVTNAMVSPFVHNSLQGSFMSQVFNLTGGDYLYLYQLSNTGTAPIEVLVVAPFANPVEAGYINDGLPTGYNSTDGKLPLKWAEGVHEVTYDAASGDLVTFGYYGGIFNGQLKSGEHTRGLYVISHNAPTTGHAYIIDGGTADVECYTPVVPEPGTMVAAMALLSPAALMFRRKRS